MKILFFCLLLLAGCADNSVFEHKDKSLASLTKEGNSLYQMSQLKAAAKVYEDIEINYPASKGIKASMKRLMNIYRRLHDEENFLEVSERYLVRYPNEKSSDEIYWIRAEYNYNKYQKLSDD